MKNNPMPNTNTGEKERFDKIRFGKNLISIRKTIWGLDIPDNQIPDLYKMFEAVESNTIEAHKMALKEIMNLCKTEKGLAVSLSKYITSLNQTQEKQ